ncbi:DNA-processing protein DprA [Nocardia iowensis]|uniref:DNA-protecting protein DprA n=1 Tax=Nocardia iowensis TaxID=204891 RepID=A0ABX8S0N7_NOCIO|nr:DNA-processing protein DprA [Nocardia iowensis]QXN94767.1 DNA-protecting protein DprA [Nocardia iowensis]
MDCTVRSSDLVPISDARRLAWAVLSRAACGPSRALWQLVDELGVENAAAAVAAGDVPVAVDHRVLERGDPDLAARDLETLHRIGGRLLTPEDPEWPTQRLAQLATRANAHADCVAPLALWVLGSASLRGVSEDPTVAVVGSGAGSGYGDLVTTMFVEDFAARGWTICSGGTMGIASRAHRVALAAAASTVAVLACGIDRAYLQHNQDLVEQIATAGLLVTEYPPQTPISRSKARARARMVAAFADAVVAIEAGRGSLARQAVFWASRLDRAAYAVPGPVTSPESAGCHDLITMDAAQLVTTAADIPHPQYRNDRAGLPEAHV